MATTEQPRTKQGPVTTEELIRFFGVLSHDLKSPIFAVDGFSDLLITDYLTNLDADGQDFVKRIRSSAQYMKRILDDMSRMVKILSRPDSRRATPLREIIEEVLLKLNFQIEEGGVRVEVPQDLPVLNVDPEKMREAIGEIISNALFFTDRPKGEREIVIEQVSLTAPARVQIRVRDNGSGIDPRYAQQIFELGSISKLDKQRGGGPGYGLFLARRVIEGHGGEMSVESAPGTGTTICFTLPA